MAEQSWNNDKKNRDLDRLFDNVSESERKNLKRVWDDSSEIDLNEPPVSKAETEDALRDVHAKLGFEDEPVNSQNTDRNNGLRYYLAAAIFLIIAGAAFILTDKKVSVPKGELAAIELPDGSTVNLNSGSEISYSRLFNYTNRDLHLNGEAYFEVEPGNHPFHVYANGSVVQVTSTKFNVRSWLDDPGSQTTVSVISGSVRFFAEGSPQEAVSLKEGSESRWISGMIRPADPDPVRIDNILAWKQRNLAFVNTPLEIIFRELERKYNTSIEITDREIGRTVMTTFYSDPEDVESVLNDITTVKGLTFSRTTNGYRVSK